MVCVARCASILPRWNIEFFRGEHTSLPVILCSVHASFMGFGNMLAFLNRPLAHRRLKPVVGSLPRYLVRGFGPAESYTFLQTKRAISDLRLGEALEPYAYAAACKFEDLQSSNVPLSEHDYRRLRAEFVDSFDLRGSSFTVMNLIKTPYAKHSPALENSYARTWANWIARSWGGSWGVSGAGLNALSSGDGCSSVDGSGSGGCDGGGC